MMGGQEPLNISGAQSPFGDRKKGPRNWTDCFENIQDLAQLRRRFALQVATYLLTALGGGLILWFWHSVIPDAAKPDFYPVTGTFIAVSTVAMLISLWCDVHAYKQRKEELAAGGDVKRTRTLSSLRRRFAPFVSLWLGFLVWCIVFVLWQHLRADPGDRSFFLVLAIFPALALWYYVDWYAELKGEVADAETADARTSPTPQSFQESISPPQDRGLPKSLAVILGGLPGIYLVVFSLPLLRSDPIQPQDWETVLTVVFGVNISVASCGLVMGIILMGLGFLARRRMTACFVGLCVTAILVSFDFLRAAQPPVLSRIDDRSVIAFVNAILFLGYLYALMLHRRLQAGASKDKDVEPPEATKVYPWLAMWTDPRETVRLIVDEDPEYHVLLLAGLFGAAIALHLSAYYGLGDRVSVPVILGICIVCGPVVGIVWMYSSAAVLKIAGDSLGGQASKPEIRAAISWASVPVLWQSLTWIPAVAFLGTQAFSSTVENLAGQPYSEFFIRFHWMTFVLVAIWYIAVYIVSLAEVQKISLALATCMMCLATFVTMSFVFFGITVILMGLEVLWPLRA